MRKPQTLTTRVTRLEKTMEELAEKTRILLDAQIKTEETFQALRKEADGRETRLDERIDRLVSAIGELIRRDGEQ